MLFQIFISFYSWPPQSCSINSPTDVTERSAFSSLFAALRSEPGGVVAEAALLASEMAAPFVMSQKSD